MYELIPAIVLGILALVAFGLQIATISATQIATQRETALFGALEFILTVGFAWFSTRAISRQEFERSLRRFAISAYRRVSDIESMLKQLHEDVGGMIIGESESRPRSDLKVIATAVASVKSVIHSSIADWADVIGDELRMITRIALLETEKRQLSTEAVAEVGNGPQGGSVQSRAEELQEKINELRAKLPAEIQYSAPFQIGPYSADSRAEWIARTHEAEGGLKLRIEYGQLYGANGDYSELKKGSQLQIRVSKTDSGLDLTDGAGSCYGQVLNDSPLDYPDWKDALERCYGTLNIPVVFEEILNERPHEPTSKAVLRVRVTIKPQIWPYRRDVDGR
jgi:hypothetical protein